MSSVYIASPLTCRCPLSWGIAAPTPPFTRSSTMASPRELEYVGLGRLAGGLEKQLVQKVLRYRAPIGRTRAHIGERCVVAIERRHRRAYAVGRPRVVDECAFAMMRTLRNSGNAAVGDSGVTDHAVLYLDAKAAADGGNVLVETLRNLVGAHRRTRHWPG